MGSLVNGIIGLLGSNRTRFSSTRLLFGNYFMYLVYSVVEIIWIMESVWAWQAASTVLES